MRPVCKGDARSSSKSHRPPNPTGAGGLGGGGGDHEISIRGGDRHAMTSRIISSSMKVSESSPLLRAEKYKSMGADDAAAGISA